MILSFSSQSVLLFVRVCVCVCAMVFVKTTNFTVENILCGKKNNKTTEGKKEIEEEKRIK